MVQMTKTTVLAGLRGPGQRPGGEEASHKGEGPSSSLSSLEVAQSPQKVGDVQLQITIPSLSLFSSQTECQQ